MRKTENITQETISKDLNGILEAATHRALVSSPIPSNTETQKQVFQTFAYVAQSVASSNYPKELRLRTPKEWIETRPDWIDKDYREAYLEGFIEQNIALQVKANRLTRGWSQSDLALKIGTKQNAVTRLEDPTYGKHSMDTLLKLAGAFDCALQIRFIPFSKLAEISGNITDQSLTAKGYEYEASGRIQQSTQDALR